MPSRISLRGLATKQEKQEVKAQLRNPMMLVACARRALSAAFGPFTYDWLCQNGPQEVPQTLLPFLKFNSEKY
jgi:hypothetical protein